MLMEDPGENFDPLRRLLALKRHEVPPPGYFNRLPGEVIARIRAEQVAGNRRAPESSWFAQLWQSFQTRPVFAGGFGAAICSLVLAGLYFSEGPADTSPVAVQAPLDAPYIAIASESAPSATAQSLLPGATNLNNSAPQSLFDLVQPLQVAPVAAGPGN